MTILFAGTSLADFLQISPGTTGADTSGVFHVTTRVRQCASYRVPTASTFGGLAVDFSPLASVYVVAQLYGRVTTATGNGASVLFHFVTNTGSRVALRFVSTSTATAALELYTVTSAGVFSGVLASFVFTRETLKKVHFSLENMGASATFKAHVDGTQQISYTGDLTAGSGATTVSRAVFGCASILNGSTQTSYWSEVVVADEDARDFTLTEAEPLANGAAFTGTGSFADIDETSYSDADVALQSNVGEVISFKPNKTRISASGNSVRAVVISARTAKGGTGPQTMEFGVTTSAGTAYAAAQALPTGLEVVQKVFATNPVSGANWVNTDVTNAAFDINLRAAT